MKNNKYKSKRFLLPILSLVLISIVSIASISSYITISMFKSHMNKYIEQTKKEYTAEHKSEVYKKVNFVNDSIEFQITQIENKLKTQLKERIEIALAVTTFTYNTYKNTHKKEEIKEKVSKALEEIKYDNNRGYYFMYDNKTKVIFGHPMKKFIGKNMTNFRDAKGRNLMQTDTKILENKKIGFNRIYFNKPDNQEEEFPKITCITKFEPLDIVIGIGEYLDIMEEKTKKMVLKRHSKIKSNGKDNYIVILDVHNLDGGDEFATVLLNSNRPDLIGRKVSDKSKDVKGNKFRKNFLELIKEKGEGYSEYWYKKPSTKVHALKISYVLFQKDWNWIILSGFYYEDLEKQISLMKSSITSYTNDTIYKTITWVLVLSLLSILVAIFVSLRIDKTIKKYTNTIIEYEDDKRKQEHMLTQQSKMAAMGEMLGNIAHQWRQPLSAISTAATGAKLQKEMNCLTEQQLTSTFDNINKSAQYLSQTIDDFRAFFNPSNDKTTEFNISNTFSKTLNILTAQFAAKSIVIVQDIEDIKLLSTENALIQVLINILNNARDALIKNQTQKRFIFIDVHKNDNNIIIEIKDNGKGIPEDIIDRIFEPYFTTKHKSQGTGIGLFMSEEIVRTHLNGSITVSNDRFIYKKDNYSGAKFTIKIPLN